MDLGYVSIQKRRLPPEIRPQLKFPPLPGNMTPSTTKAEEQPVHRPAFKRQYGESSIHGLHERCALHAHADTATPVVAMPAARASQVSPFVSRLSPKRKKRCLHYPRLKTRSSSQTREQPRQAYPKLRDETIKLRSDACPLILSRKCGLLLKF